MMTIRQGITASLVAASVATGMLSSERALAAPFVGAPIASAAHQGVTDVYWRHGGGWRFPFWGAPAIIGGVIIGGALMASAVAEHRADRVAMQRCADDFPSFSWRTGTFINRNGEERVCPYLN